MKWLLDKLRMFFSDTKPNEKPKQKIKAARIGALGEYKIELQLSQLPQEYIHMSDIMIANPKSRTQYSQIDHIVLTPYAIFVVETKNYSGYISGKKEQANWYVNKRFKMYSPIRQNYGHIKALERLLSDHKLVPFVSIVSFNRRCTFQVDAELRNIQSNELVVYDTEFSEFVTRKCFRMKMEGGVSPLSMSSLEVIESTIRRANIVDPEIRKRIVTQTNES